MLAHKFSTHVSPHFSNNSYQIQKSKAIAHKLLHFIIFLLKFNFQMQIVKYTKISFSFCIWRKIYGNISLISVKYTLNSTKYPLFTQISINCNLTQIIEFHSFLVTFHENSMIFGKVNPFRNIAVFKGVSIG